MRTKPTEYWIAEALRDNKAVIVAYSVIRKLIDDEAIKLIETDFIRIRRARLVIGVEPEEVGNPLPTLESNPILTLL